MNRLKIVLAWIAAVVFAALWMVQYRAATGLQRENALLRHQLEEARSASLKLSGESQDTDKLTQAQRSELLKLRAEVTQLREQTNAMTTLREENEKLQARGDVSNQAAEHTASTSAGEEIHEKESWAFVGQGSPEASFQSMLWAFSQTNKEAFLASVDTNTTPLDSALSDEDFNRQAADESAKIKSFRFTAPSETFGKFSVVSVYMEDSRPGETGKAVDFLFKKNGDSWQVVGASQKKVR